MDENKLKILCPFCNKAYTAEMENELDGGGGGCESCGYGGEATSKVTITCSNCEKVVYIKEFEE